MSSQPAASLLAQLGPFFEVGVESELNQTARFRPLRDLQEPDVLGERVEHVRSALSALRRSQVEPRVAASTMSLGLFARLVSPVLGAAALRIAQPRASLDTVWWRPVARGPWPLVLSGAAVGADPGAVLNDVVAPLAKTIATRYRLSTRILRGNAASAVFGAVETLARTRTDLGDGAREHAAALLEGPLHGTGGLRDGRFVRASCCLYYRIPGGGYCGDCVLAHR